MIPTLLEAMFEINLELMFEINEAIVLVAVIVVAAVTGVILVWFLRSQAAATATRTLRMMTRVSLDRAFATHGDPKFKAIMKEVLRRCGCCRLEDLCDRSFAGKVKGDDAFCPNARILRDLARTSAPTG